jgi:hypothetical protein
MVNIHTYYGQHTYILRSTYIHTTVNIHTIVNIHTYYGRHTYILRSTYIHTMINIHIYFDHFTPGFLLFYAFYTMGKRRLNAVFRQKMWINLFLKRLRKKNFDKVNAIKRPVYGTFLPQRSTVHFIIPQ